MRRAAPGRVDRDMQRAALDAYRRRQVDRASALQALVDAGVAHDAAERNLATIDEKGKVA